MQYTIMIKTVYLFNSEILPDTIFQFIVPYCNYVNMYIFSASEINPVLGMQSFTPEAKRAPVGNLAGNCRHPGRQIAVPIRLQGPPPLYAQGRQALGGDECWTPTKRPWPALDSARRDIPWQRRYEKYRHQICLSMVCWASQCQSTHIVPMSRSSTHWHTKMWWASLRAIHISIAE